MFSIIVPIYEVEQYLEKCIYQLINQTYRNIEIILVNDGSTDNSPSICDKYAAMDERIKVIHKKNGGLSDARNKGLEMATKEYILFIDSDDYIELNSCEKFIPFAEKGYDVLIGDAIVEGGICGLYHIGSIGTIFSGQEYLEQALTQNKAPMAVCLNAYKREFLVNNKLEFKFGILHEDEQFTPRVFLQAKTIIYTGVVFYHYIIREGSIMTQKDKRRNAIDLFSTCCELETLYGAVSNNNLCRLLKNSLVVKYLDMFQNGKLYQYGKSYIHKSFCRRNAFNMRTRLKVDLFCLSPKLYWHINKMLKLIG